MLLRAEIIAGSPPATFSGSWTRGGVVSSGDCGDTVVGVFSRFDIKCRHSPMQRRRSMLTETIQPALNCRSSVRYALGSSDQVFESTDKLVRFAESRSCLSS